jgi:hypothetical protein
MDETSRRLSRRNNLILFAPLALVAFVLFIALGGEIVRLLWNWLMPALFGWTGITFWQALGLLALCRILFGGLGLHGASGSRIRSRMRERWEERRSERWEERWGQMTPEERERFRQGMRGRGAPGPFPDEGQDS